VLAALKKDQNRKVRGAEPEGNYEQKKTAEEFSLRTTNVRSRSYGQLPCFLSISEKKSLKKNCCFGERARKATTYKKRLHRNTRKPLPKRKREQSVSIGGLSWGARVTTLLNSKSLSLWGEAREMEPSNEQEVWDKQNLETVERADKTTEMARRRRGSSRNRSKKRVRK